MGTFARLALALSAFGHELNLVRVNAAEKIQIDGRAIPSQFMNMYVEGPEVGSSVPWVVDEMFLASLPELELFQEGYRWGAEHKRLELWPDEWVVVASIMGDPLFVDITKSELPVFFAPHGCGGWVPSRLSPGLEVFLDVLENFESVLLGEFSSDVWDEDGLRIDFLGRLEEILDGALDRAEQEVFFRMLD